jgi:Ca2+-binding RTX toxin-like protein
MVMYIKSDLQFILEQIKISEAHADGQPLFGPGGLIPAYNLSLGLRTVDGTYNHLLPGQEKWGAADQPFPEPLGTNFRPGETFDPDGPGPIPAMPTNYDPSNVPGSIVVDSSLRTISNLLVDQTLGNPAAVLTALERAGSANATGELAAVTTIYQAFKPAFDAEYQARVVMQSARADYDAARAPFADDNNPATPPVIPTPEQEQAIVDAFNALTAATTNHEDAVAALETARAVRDAALEPYGIAMDGDNVHLPNVAPDEGLSAPFNSWFTLFGQFFDHGLDLVNKGGSGTVFVPLQPDDPLYVEGSHTNFMVLTRATVGPGADGIMGDNPATVGVNEGADDTRPVNTTTSFVDQNQTYTSHPSHQVFLREYVFNAAGDPVATGKLIEGPNGGMANWGQVKALAAALLGIQLTDFDVGGVPLLRTDAYGNFIPGANGLPQLITGLGADGIPNTDDDVVVEGNIAAPVDPTAVSAIRTSHAFLADIAHEAVPVGKVADGDITIGLANPGNGDAEYDNELLDAHFIAGDGRANENIGLTAVHHVFHSEHNRLVEHTKDVILATGDDAFIQEWLVDGADLSNGVQGLEWNGERLFQAAKFGTEMQYQHLVFEEFARKIQPQINPFLVPDGFDTTMNPSIVAEFAHVVYRFGHSMLTESIDRFDPNFLANDISLIQGFLNPTAFNGPNGIIDDGIAAGAIIRGMTRQVGNEIDEFVTSALRNNLLGLPLDLATINLARGRDTGVPSLNAARADFYEATDHNVLLKPYESWVDFAGHLKHEASIINFIAAYGTHELITTETTIEGKRDAALTLITGAPVGKFAAMVDFVMPTDAVAFLNGTGDYAGTLGGLNNVDLWIGGLAEETMPFGGMLGSTFNFVFEVQMENLQSGDRFYYLQRLDGLHLFSEMEANSFAAMIMRNTDATHLPSDVFSTPGLILEVDQSRQFNDLDGDGILDTTDPVAGGILTPLVSRDNPATPGADTNYLRYTGGDHVVLGGTDEADILIAGIGDDTLFGDGGNDNLQGGFGNDIINAGDGDDIVTDSGGDDNIKAGDGNDVVHAGPGLDLVMGGRGQDFIILGTDAGSEVFAGEGNDFVYGNKNAERILGNEGNDWIETGTFDGAPGDNFDEIFSHDGIDGHDVFLGDGGFDEFIGEGGDDIMVGSPGRGKAAGMSGWDWMTYKDNSGPVNADLSLPIIFDEAPTLPANAALDEFQSVEGLSGSRFSDTLRGSNVLAEERVPALPGGTEGFAGSALDLEGVALISGLQDVVGGQVTQENPYSAGDIILGGDGGDVIIGQGGDDIIDGDKWLDVQIGVFAPGDIDHTEEPLEWHNSMTALSARMFSGAINPAQLGIVRTIRTDTSAGDTDIAAFSDLRANYDITFNEAGNPVRVAHARGTQTDGTDTLHNIERLHFADDGPVAGNDFATVAEGGSVITVNVLDNDFDPDTLLTAANITAFSQGANGSVVNNGNGTFTYVHSGTETISDSFTYTIDDLEGGTDTATVNVTVNPVNDAPVARDDAATVAEGGSVTTVNVLANDSDPDSTLTATSITAFSQGTNGIVVDNGDGTFTYTHDGSETTSDGFTYTINDGAGGTDTATVNVTINPVTDGHVPPVVSHGSGDFDGDGVGEHLLRRGDGTFQILDINANQVTAHVLGTVGTEWRFIGNGDFNGNGVSDMLTVRDSDNMLHVHTMGSNQIVGAGFVGQVGSEWNILGIGDFNDDGTDDILSQRDGDGVLHVHQMNDTQVSGSAFIGAIGTDWNFLATGDFNNDGTSDLLWQHDNDVLIHDVQSNQIVGSALVGQIGSEWHFAGIGDFDGDHTDDVLWQADNGTLLVYDINNNQVTNAPIVEILPADMHVAGIGDFTGDGTDDLVLRDDGGTFQLQHIDDNLVTSTVTLGPVSNEWFAI